MNKLYFILSLLVLTTVPKQVLAHGANIEYRETSAINIQAKYDDGTPMANAQVVIYAPSDRTTPWLKGTTDQSGNFTFVPDTNAENIGNWDVKVRQSGHGDITSIPVSKEAENAAITQLSSDGSDYTSAQKAVMAAAGVWGFIGTALFFSRSKSSKLD
ncbi:carboxypeptidase regulatory-like domain-containing protein [Pleurocapsales cyanobacterium LEGE 10410]|nr:carboxypeptidase regulatory-like domain-containing protein [Pleurocapsales cyanobacterium LEGE 10410]